MVAMLGSSTLHVGSGALVANITLKVPAELNPECATFGKSLRLVRRLLDVLHRASAGDAERS